MIIIYQDFGKKIFSIKKLFAEEKKPQLFPISQQMFMCTIFCSQNGWGTFNIKLLAQPARAVEYTNCFSAEE